MGETAEKQAGATLPINRREQNKNIKKGSESLTAYDDEMIDRFMSGIVQNIKMETFRRGLSNYELAALSNISYIHISKLFNGMVGIGLPGLIKLSFALDRHPADFMPLDVNHRKTNGERFDELTKDLDIDSCNFLLQMVAEYCKQFRRVKFDMQTESGFLRKK